MNLFLGPIFNYHHILLGLLGESGGSIDPAFCISCPVCSNLAYNGIDFLFNHTLSFLHKISRRSHLRSSLLFLGIPLQISIGEITTQRKVNLEHFLEIT